MNFQEYNIYLQSFDSNHINIERKARMQNLVAPFPYYKRTGRTVKYKEGRLLG